ncbi:hypothetical protein M9H77_34651 [Catharanthus roseus]|uniref:Uncharacterized protein n=1 Tax=Catharanthus roseus TaxID=4058 RepID=A0ACB9ZN01_CATRO|nr:hypothetical protein M9H77_34651 [Catharanthus roseus]
MFKILAANFLTLFFSSSSKERTGNLAQGSLIWSCVIWKGDKNNPYGRCYGNLKNLRGAHYSCGSWHSIANKNLLWIKTD